MQIKNMFLAGMVIIMALSGCGRICRENITDMTNKMTVTDTEESVIETGSITAGIKEYRGFILDNVYHSSDEGDIHFNVYIPDTYDGSKPYALFMTLPGYQGLYFQGVGENLKTENIGFTAQKYNSEMIIVAPQLNDWGETSARQTIALTDYLQGRPQWDGDYEPVVMARTPVYIVIGENDEYYGSEPSKEAYENIRALYEKEGISDEEIDKLLVLDIKDSSYFSKAGINNQHGGGAALFFEDDGIMSWLFGWQKS